MISHKFNHFILKILNIKITSLSITNYFDTKIVTA